MADWIAFILLFIIISAAEITTRQRAVDRKIARNRAVLEFTGKFIFVLAMYIGLDIGYRELNGGAPSPLLSSGALFVVGIGMLAVYLHMVSSMLKKLNEAGISK